MLDPSGSSSSAEYTNPDSGLSLSSFGGGGSIPGSEFRPQMTSFQQNAAPGVGSKLSFGSSMGKNIGNSIQTSQYLQQSQQQQHQDLGDIGTLRRGHARVTK